MSFILILVSIFHSRRFRSIRNSFLSRGLLRGSQWGGSSDGWRLIFYNFDGWWLNFRAFNGWRLLLWKFSPRVLANINFCINLFQLLCFGGCLGLSFIKFQNTFRYTQVLRSCNVQKECFWEHGNWFSSLELDSSGARSPWR